MTAEKVRVSPDWLTLREPADAAARSPELVELVRSHLPAHGGVAVHDLGSGTGSMARWLAVHLAGPQHWVLYDRDEELLARAAAHPPPRSADGSPVTVEVRGRDITRLDPEELAGANLVTASALLDMMTAEDLDRLVVSAAGAGCPVLFALTVTGHVELTPTDPLDRCITDAFNAHQRRASGGRRLLGPDALDAAVEGFGRLGFDVLLRPSPWRLGPGQSALAAEWLMGWVDAACEQHPELSAVAPSYARRRLAEAAAGRLSVVVHHQDLLARPR